MAFHWSNAQLTTHTMAYAGYQYQNQSFGDVGLRFLFLKQDDWAYRVAGGVLLGSTHSSFVAVPKLQTEILFNSEKNVDIQHAYYYLAGADFTPHYIAPKLGLSLFGIVDLSAGYAFSIDSDGLKGKELKGWNMNFSVNIPLVVFQK